ncbi:hypothetical protein D3C86_1831560 [compost metagenome]
MPEGEAHQPVHRLGGVVLIERQGAFALADFLVGVEQYRPVEIFLIAEVVVEQALIGLGPVGNGVDARALKTAIGKFHPRRRQDRRLGLGRIAGAFGRGWLSLGRRRHRA